eukprot:986715_1
MSNPRRDIVNFFLSDSEIGAEILKTLSVFRTTMSCNSFSFIPFTNTLHSWKYDKAKYYRHVLSGLFSVSPNETAKNARIILQSNTSFLANINELLCVESLKGSWDFTCPEEGKYLHDQAGGRDKTTLRKNAHKIVWGQDNSYSITAKKFLEKHNAQRRFNQLDRQQKHLITRRYFIVDPKTIIVCKSPYKTLDGITKYFHFNFQGFDNEIQYRKFGCHCIACLEYRFESCTRTYICGEWNKHVFKLKPPETEDKPPGKRRLTRGADLKLFVLDYHQLKVMKASDFEHKKAFTELNIGSLKTLNKYLSIIHCMQRKGVTFTQKFGDESMKHVVKNYLEYDKLELLYKDEQNQINSDFTLDMQGLGIELDNCNDVTMNNASNDDFTLDMPGLGSGLDNVINLSNATTAIQSVSGLRLPVINGTNLTQYGHHVDRNAISWNDNVTFRHNPMNTMHMQEPRNAFGSGYYNPYM